MRLTENQLRKIVRKTILIEGQGMKTAINLPDNIGIEMHKRSSRRKGQEVSFSYAKFHKGEVEESYASEALPGPDGIHGLVTIKKINKIGEDCDGAWVITGFSSSADGYGPLLYDIAMEYASIPTNGTGLVSDRGRVSNPALGVWDYYDKYRTNKDGDVIKFQCDDMKNTLTDTNKDNMSQQTAISKVGNDFTLSSISKKYTKFPPVTIEYFKINNRWDVW